MHEKIALQLTHRDVYLQFFIERKNEILKLRGGDILHYNNLSFYNPATGNPVARLSRKMAGTLSGWETKGYRVCSASVRFIVAWRPKYPPAPETAVTLIDLNLSKTARQKATIS